MHWLLFYCKLYNSSLWSNMIDRNVFRIEFLLMTFQINCNVVIIIQMKCQRFRIRHDEIWSLNNKHSVEGNRSKQLDQHAHAETRIVACVLQSYTFIISVSCSANTVFFFHKEEKLQHNWMTLSLTILFQTCHDKIQNGLGLNLNFYLKYKWLIDWFFVLLLFMHSADIKEK